MSWSTPAQWAPGIPSSLHCQGSSRPGKESRSRSEEHTSELQSPVHLVCRLLLEKKDRSDRVLRPAILWNDQRTARECSEIERTLGLERLIALTGNRALPGFTAPKLLWLRRHEPETYAAVAKVMLPKDYVRARLCDAQCTDVFFF